METKELEAKLGEILTQLKEQKAAAEAEQKKFGTMLTETAEKLTALQKQADALDVKLAEKHAASEPDETVVDALKKNDGLVQFIKDRGTGSTKSFGFELTPKQVRQLREIKTTLTTPDLVTPGVAPIERLTGIVPEARQSLTVRNVLTARPTTMQMVYFVKVDSPMTIASPQQGESHTKKENAASFTTGQATVQTIATWIPVSRQALEDFDELMNFLQTSLMYYVDLAEEEQLLSGSGSTVELNGLITQATAFSTGLLPLTGAYNKIDYIGRAVQQITSAKELMPTFLVLNPADWWDIRLTKDTQGRYILGDPMQPLTNPNLFGLTPVPTTSVPSGTFLVGSGNPMASEIRDRMGLTVEIAPQHGTYFTENLVAVRAEKRIALCVKRPASYITGTFTTSP